MNTEELLHKERYTHDEIVQLLSLSKEEEVQNLYKRADEVRKIYCGDEVHLRAVIEITNYCSQNCLYCRNREDNFSIKRYRLATSEIIDLSKQISNLGIYTIILQSGQDSYFDTDMIAYLIYSIKQTANIAITLSLGERRYDEYRAWKIAGADRYILKYTTSNAKHYELYHKNKNLSDRINHLKFLKGLGFQVGSGNIIGLPFQTLDDIANDILLSKEIDFDSAIFSPFIPAPFTPYQNKRGVDIDLTLKTIAVARIVLKDMHIPAPSSLGKIDTQGRIKGLEAGANVVTPDFTPQMYKSPITPNKLKKTELRDSSLIKSNLSLQIESIGRKIADNKGDSFKHQIDLNRFNYR
jgi:biotin synthase